MATEKVGVHRKYHGPIPKDESDQPLPRCEWPRKRDFRWAVRWFGSNGRRFSRSFSTRKEVLKDAKQIQLRVDKGKPDKPRKITLGDFNQDHEIVMRGQVADKTLKDQMRALRLFADHIGNEVPMVRINPLHAESFVSHRLAEGLAVGTVNKDIRTLKGILTWQLNFGVI